jgi:hypothetical protein
MKKYHHQSPKKRRNQHHQNNQNQIIIHQIKVIYYKNKMSLLIHKLYKVRTEIISYKKIKILLRLITTHLHIKYLI